MTDAGAPSRTRDVDDLSTAQLITKATQQTSELVRSELALAKAEIQQTVTTVGTGAGLFGAAGLIALYAAACFVAAAVLALAAGVPPWLAAVIVGVVLAVAAGIAAVLGRKKISTASSPMATTKANVHRDVETVKGERS